ncbi:dihydropteroate synthase [Frigidibacter oleivorans]|uniref:dihydropteroate synthase n=1 Tax=Frigidibacter oleivorans TaxID=2487129 RepID=UPI000F8D71D5|nr:dihydropteroate synthase [Frigidibacter oleivorans]
MSRYYRPIPMTDPARPAGALPLAGGWCWFDRAEVLTRAGSEGVVPAGDLPDDLLARLTAPRPALAGLTLDRPRVMAVLNVTPDSFSDGGRYLNTAAALQQAHTLRACGAEIIDIGGESTRPGAPEVPLAEEIARTAPVIEALHRADAALPLSIDTRKSAVADMALQMGAGFVNDVSGLTFDPALAPLVADRQVPVCLMHMRGTPETMAADTAYENVLLDVFDWLAARIAAAEAAGIPRARIWVDPGIGFAKTAAQNLELIRGLSLLHGLGCPILLGVSRKRFVGTIGGEARPDRRAPGTLALVLAGIAQGAQVHRVHDVAEVVQGIRLWQAVQQGVRE